MSIPSFSTYQPPGVYVQDVSAPIIVPSLVPSQTLALVGPALGYRSAVQSLLISSVTAVPLTFKGVFTTAQAGPPPIPAPVVTTVSGTVLTVGVDYTFTTVNDPSGNPALASVTVSRIGTSPNVSNGQQVTVTYAYADASYYQPQTFTDPASVTRAYGQPYLTSVPVTPNASQIANPLSAAAQVAFANGASTLICVALNPADGNLEQQYIAAYARIANTPAVTIVVPVLTDDLTPGSGTVAAYCQLLAQDLNAAMVSATSNGNPRIGIFGTARNYSESDVPITTLAANIASKRLVLAYPEIVLFYNPSTSQVFNAAGCYLAVALGGLLSSLPVNTGLTNQVIKGVAGLTQTEIANMTVAFMNSLAAAGAAVCYLNYRQALVCRQGLTTDTSALNRAEISLVRQSDALLVAVQQGLQGSGLIGQPITSTTVSVVQEAVIGILEAAITNAIIVSYTNLSVVQQTYPQGNPTIIAVTFQYQPAQPLNYITVSMSINLTNGVVSSQSNQNASATGT